VRGEVWPGLTLLGNVGRYARVPNLTELFGRSGVVVGNPRLEPEIAFNRDVGFRFARASVTPWLADVGLEYSYFDNDIDQLVFLRPVGQVTVRPENLDSAHVTGDEVSARGRLWDRVGLVVNYTHQDARNTGSTNVKTHDKRVPGLPADEVYARVELAWSPTTPLPFGKWCRDWWPGRVYYDLDAMSDDFLDVQNSARKHVDGRLYHGVGLEVSLPQKFRIGVEVKNAGDDSTRDAFRFPLPGRAIFATVSWGFGAAASAVER
jgi:outer membrane receptor protein involved in Fe transport